ncbi:MAG: molybdenum cofactor synthesis domain [Frankiales bacterium]|nr:molybdenum cofactor synthesis domain [Frankiales bacterium]
MAAVEGLPTGARAAVITVSDRSHGGLRHDSSGPLLASLLSDLGFAVGGVVVVPDDIVTVQDAVRAAVADGNDVVATTGGTGFAPRDVTPEAVRPMLERDAPGIVEALRQHRRDEVPTTILSRAVAGTIGSSFVVTLPGSTGGVRDGVAVLAPVVGHLVAQLRGGDH